MKNKILIDINRNDYYMYSKPELRKRTRNRLIEMAELGMEDLGGANFGIRNVMSGLYIETVWSFTDEEFNQIPIQALGKILKNQTDWQAAWDIAQAAIQGYRGYIKSLFDEGKK